MESKSDKHIAIRAALKLDKSLKLWVWGWASYGDRMWFELHPVLHDCYLNQNATLAVSKEEPTWSPTLKQKT